MNTQKENSLVYLHNIFHNKKHFVNTACVIHPSEGKVCVFFLYERETWSVNFEGV